MGHRAIIFINNKFTMLQLSKELYEFSIMYNKDQGSSLICLRKSGSLNMLSWRAIMKLLKVQIEDCVPNFYCIHVYNCEPKIQTYEN